MNRFDALAAALEAQAEAKKAYYKARKVGEWKPLYEHLRAANTAVIKAARAYVNAVNGGGDGCKSGIEPGQDLADSGEDSPASFLHRRAS